MDKKIVSVGTVVILIVAAFFIIKNNSTGISGESIGSEVENLREAKLSIEGMYCQACAYGVEAQIKELDGVVDANINYQDASGLVLYDGDKLSPEIVAAASTAYPVTVIEDKAK